MIKQVRESKLKIIKILISLIVISISTYGLITKDFSYMAFANLLLGMVIGIFAFEEFKYKGKNGWGMFYLPVSILVIGMALFSF